MSKQGVFKLVLFVHKELIRPVRTNSNGFLYYGNLVHGALLALSTRDFDRAYWRFTTCVSAWRYFAVMVAWYE
jgi:hypothetical protein